MSRKILMQRDPDDVGLFSLAAFQTLRIEALDMFDRCLAEHKPEYLERFLERQIAQETPPLELLSQIAEDVHQRLLTLRQRHFEVAEQVRLTLERDYDVDPAMFVPADLFDESWRKLEDFLTIVGCNEAHAGEPTCREMQTMLLDAREQAMKLYTDVQLADQLYTYLTDWLLALHVVTARGAWTDLTVDENGLIQ